METEFYIDSYDNNNFQPNIELGTKEFPFRSLDDAFRTLFNYNQHNETVKFTINIRHGANITINSEDMPLILLNSNIELRPYTDDSKIDMK